MPEVVFPSQKSTQVLISVHPGPPVGSREGREEDASRKRDDQWRFKVGLRKKGMPGGSFCMTRPRASAGRGKGRGSTGDGRLPETNWDRQGRRR